jgi:hypothetical protein
MKHGQRLIVHPQSDQSARVEGALERDATDERGCLGRRRNITADEVNMGRAWLRPDTIEQVGKPDAGPFGVADRPAFPANPRHPRPEQGSPITSTLQNRGYGDQGTIM